MTTPRGSFARRSAAILAAIAATPALAQTQPAPAQPASTQPKPAGDQPLPPALRLGLRVLMVQNHAHVRNHVVIVSDPASYLAAIAMWTPDDRFPVLIDDGSTRAHEEIARFVRGFQPQSVCRWQAPGLKTDAKPGPWAVPRADIVAAVARAWGLDAQHADVPSLLEAWKARKHEPPGLVMMHEGDGAWPAGAALAAARGEVMVFVQSRQGIDSLASPAEADELAKAAENVAEISGWPWKSTGDALDAVTLCLNTPNRIDKGKGEFLAMTDRIGRLGTGVEAKDRWAWAGQIFGPPSTSAYRAMSALFMPPHGAWVFDGYADTPPWNQWSGARAADVLKNAGLATECASPPKGGARDWRLRACRPIDAGIVLVNSKGNDDFFDLEPGRCKPGDVPLAIRPFAMHIVHSWSASNAGNRDRLAGRWLERGAFLYAGSVHEPYLQAFVPTPVIAGRLVGGGAFGASVRPDAAPLWKITVLGDPLYTLGKPAPRRDDPPALEGLADITAHLRDDLQQQRYPDAIAALALSGRDEDIAKLVEALLAKTPEAVTPGLAACSVLPLARAARHEALWRVYARMSLADQHDPERRDALWLVSDPLLRGSATPELCALLAANIRDDMPGRDAATLAGAIHRTRGADAAMQTLRSIRDQTPDAARRREIEDVMTWSPDAWSN